VCVYVCVYVHMC